MKSILLDKTEYAEKYQTDEGAAPNQGFQDLHVDRTDAVTPDRCPSRAIPCAFSGPLDKPTSRAIPRASPGAG